MKKPVKAVAGKQTEKPTRKKPRRRVKPVAVVLSAERIGTKLKVMATHDEKTIHVDTINHDIAPQRERFLNGVVKRLPGVDAVALEAELLRLPSTLPAPPVAEPETVTAPETPPPSVKVMLSYNPDRSGRKGNMTAEYNGATVHLDAMEPSNAKQRKQFIKDLKDKLPELDVADTEKQLFEIAELATAEPPCSASSNAGNVVELDVSSIIRPEMFYHPDLSGLTLPIILSAGGNPIGKYMTYLRWSDGRRERKELPNDIEVQDGKRLFIRPKPAEPDTSTPPSWSMASRQSWLDGSPAPDPVDLLCRLTDRFAYFIDFIPEMASGTASTLALWTVFTHCFQAWDAVPYLSLGGPANSGKSRVFELLTRLVFRPMNTSNVTGPALFRTLNDRGGVVLLDEAERLKQSDPAQQEILSMLLAGYKRGGRATRLEKVEDNFHPVQFDVYGPKALACIAGLPPALATRCIHIAMFRSGPNSEKPRRRIDDAPNEWQRLRDELHVLALEHGSTWLALAQNERRAGGHQWQRRGTMATSTCPCCLL